MPIRRFLIFDQDAINAMTIAFEDTLRELSELWAKVGDGMKG
jgi:hypothetical protein